MKIYKVGEAGSMEPGDIHILIEANVNPGILVELSGKQAVLKQFGEHMKSLIFEMIRNFELEDVRVEAQDNGALDYAIRARMEGAIRRAIE